MRNLIYYLLLFIITATQAQSKMSITEAKALKNKVKIQSTSTQTILCDFVQYKHLDFLDNDVETSGKLAFKAPDIIKWEYLKPFKYAILFKDNKMYINDGGKKNDMDINSNKLFKQLNALIINSIKGDLFDENAFIIDYYKNEITSLVHFFPKDQKFAKYIKVFHITFNNNGDVLEVKMIEPSNDYSKIVFKNKVLNNPLGDALFTN